MWKLFFDYFLINRKEKNEKKDCYEYEYEYVWVMINEWHTLIIISVYYIMSPKNNLKFLIGTKKVID